MKHQFRRDRSDFWITVYNNDDESYNISTNSKYIELINFFYPRLEENSPTKWKDSEKYPQTSSLWLPEGCYDHDEMESFMKWCDCVTQEVLWLNLNKNIERYFDDELDFCIASDFNFVYGNGRTEIGEAEYQLKYNSAHISQAERQEYANVIMDKMMDNCKYIPMGNKNNWCLSPLPSTESGKEKLAWILADEMSNYLGVSFIDATLAYDKPQMKQLSIEDKIETWEEIYNNGDVLIDKTVKGKNVIVIDDLYQSGTTMWQYANFLKKMGARSVFGIVCVKSLKDSDNK